MVWDFDSRQAVCEPTWFVNKEECPYGKVLEVRSFIEIFKFLISASSERVDNFQRNIVC